MKRALALFTVLLLTVSGFSLIFGHSLLKEKDQVSITTEILYGDASAAEGISVNTGAQYDRHLFWDTTYEAGPNPSASTDYTFYSVDHRIERESVDSCYINFDIQNYNLDPTRPRKEHFGIDQALYDLYYDESIFYKENSNRLNKAKLVYLKDYYEYYPISLHATIGKDSFYYDPVEASYTSQDTELSDLADFFRIPIIENDTRMINIEQFSKTDYSTYIDFSETHPSYFFDNYSLVTDDSLFYTFTLSDSLGNTDETSKVDFSHVPGGYGIYRIPYTTEETVYGNKYQLTPDAISMAYPLDPSICIFSFSANKDRSKLFLAYHDKNTPEAVTEFAVIDAKTMETLQVIQLEGIAKTDGSTEVLIPYNLYIEDDFLALQCSSEYLVILELKDSELYELECVINLHANPIFEYAIDIPWRTALDWNGEQLAIAGSNQRKFGTHRYALSCGFYLAIFDKNGLVYYSEQDSSLDKGPSPMGPYTPVQPLYDDYGDLLMSVKWEK